MNTITTTALLISLSGAFLFGVVCGIGGLMLYSARGLVDETDFNGF